MSINYCPHCRELTDVEVSGAKVVIQSNNEDLVLCMYCQDRLSELGVKFKDTQYITKKEANDNSHYNCELCDEPLES